MALIIINGLRNTGWQRVNSREIVFIKEEDTLMREV